MIQKIFTRQTFCFFRYPFFIVFLTLTITSCVSDSKTGGEITKVPEKPSMRFIESNGIRMRIAEMGEGPLVVLIHGWPESWYSWRHQIPYLAKNGYRVVAPDMRGFGESDAPEQVEEYDILKLTGDVVGILDALNENTAIVVGHDWGANIAWDCALLHPERFSAVITLANPYHGRDSGSNPPMENHKKTVEENFDYMLYFQEPEIAEAEFDADPQAILSRIYATISSNVPREDPEVTDSKRDAGGLIPRIGKPKKLPDWFKQQDLDYYVKEYERAGFRGGVNYYRNIDRNWRLMTNWAGKKLQQPFLFIAGANDHNLWGADKKQLNDQFGSSTKDFSGVVLIPRAAHFVNQSKPEKTNRLILNFLKSL